jgi:predicted alpha/beta superfamily hydrolase
LRVRDLTPCSDPLLEAQYPDRELSAGGATAFLEFIQGQLKPFLAQRYPIDADDQTLVGSSLAGLFVLNTLLTTLEAFHRYVAISPAIYWAGGRLFELEALLAARSSDLAARVFLAAGALEEAHDPKQGFVSNVYRMEAALRARNYPGLSLERRIFDGETHMSVYPGAVTYGIASVFGGYRDIYDWSRWLNRPQ